MMEPGQWRLVAGQAKAPRAELDAAEQAHAERVREESARWQARQQAE